MPTLRCTLWNFFYVEVFVKCLDPKSFVLSRHHSPHSRVAPHKIFLLKVPPGTNCRRACACGDNSMSNASQYKHKSNVHTNHLGASSSWPPFKMRESRGHYVLAGEAPQRGHRWSQCSQPYRKPHWALIQVGVGRRILSWLCLGFVFFRKVGYSKILR